MRLRLLPLPRSGGGVAVVVDRVGYQLAPSAVEQLRVNVSGVPDVLGVMVFAESVELPASDGSGAHGIELPRPGPWTEGGRDEPIARWAGVPATDPRPPEVVDEQGVRTGVYMLAAEAADLVADVLDAARSHPVEHAPLRDAVAALDERFPALYLRGSNVTGPERPGSPSRKG